MLYYQMLDGNQIPQVGLGVSISVVGIFVDDHTELQHHEQVYEMTDEEAYQAVIWALEAGYRHIDTAEWYENEAACGTAIVDFLSMSRSFTRHENSLSLIPSFDHREQPICSPFRNLLHHEAQGQRIRIQYPLQGQGITSRLYPRIH